MGLGPHTNIKLHAWREELCFPNPFLWTASYTSGLSYCHWSLNGSASDQSLIRTAVGCCLDSYLPHSLSGSSDQSLQSRCLSHTFSMLMHSPLRHLNLVGATQWVAAGAQQRLQRERESKKEGKHGDMQAQEAWICSFSTQ